MSNTLYVLGNGFDLYHKMSTSYWHFKEYLKQTNRELYNIVDEYLSIDQNWSDFEEALGHINVDQIIEEASEQLQSYNTEKWKESYHHDFQFYIEEIVQELSSKLHNNFCEWLKQIEVHTESELLNINQNAYFLTFNYTPTLNSLYQIPLQNVFHIHGEIESGTTDIVLGHSWSPNNRKPLSDLVDEETDTRISEGYGIVDQYFGSTYKPTNDIIDESVSYFENLSDIKNVYVLGHSMSDVDIEYFKKISQSVSADCKWFVSFHNPNDKKALIDAVAKFPIVPGSITYIKITDVT